MFLPRRATTGGQRYLLELSTHMQRCGVPVVPIYLKDRTQAKHGLALALDCLLENARLFRDGRRPGNMSAAVFFEDFHLHPRLWLFNLLIRVAGGRLTTVVLVQSPLFYHRILRHWWARWLDRLVVRVFVGQATLILTNSEFTRREVLSLGTDPTRVTTIYCGYEGVPTPAKSSALRPPQSPDGTQILFVGQCVELKGLEVLLEAFAMLDDGAAKLDLVGNTGADPQYFTSLTRMVEELVVQDRVAFHGHVSDTVELAGFYQRADVFVLPSIAEGFGIVLLNAMAWGLPIVATQTGGIPELIQDGVNGLLVPPGDPVALARALGRLLDSFDLRKRCGQAGQTFVAEHGEFYSWDAVGERALQAMGPLLEQPHL